jgi:hypothetical protein
MKSFLFAAVAALVLVSSASAQRFNVRVNNFTPFNIRPDVRVSGAGGNVNVFANGHVPSTTVFVNGFNRGFNGNPVFVNSNGFGATTVYGVPPTTVFVRPSGVAVTPNGLVPLGFDPRFGIVPLASPPPIYGYHGGYGGFGYGGFSTFGTGGCGY